MYEGGPIFNTNLNLKHFMVYYEKNWKLCCFCHTSGTHHNLNFTLEALYVMVISLHTLIEKNVC